MQSTAATTEAPTAQRVELEDLFPLDNPPPPFTEAMLRWYARHREQNGFGACLVHIGRRHFVSRKRLEEWLVGQLVQQGPARQARRAQNRGA